jgi:hypothetical protein
MGVDDNEEKLADAWELIETAVVDTDEYDAAYFYLDATLTVHEDIEKLYEIDHRRWKAMLLGRGVQSDSGDNPPE